MCGAATTCKDGGDGDDRVESREGTDGKRMSEAQAKRSSMAVAPPSAASASAESTIALALCYVMLCLVLFWCDSGTLSEHC